MGKLRFPEHIHVLTEQVTRIAENGGPRRIDPAEFPDPMNKLVRAINLLIDTCPVLPNTPSPPDNMELFRQINENIHEVFWLGAPDWTNIHYISPAYETVWGNSCESLYLDPQSWVNSVHPDDVATLTAEIQQRISGERKNLEFSEYRIIRPDGSVRWIAARAYPIYNDTGEIYRIAGIAEDITQRKLNEEIVYNLSKFPEENPNPVLRFSAEGALLYKNEAVDKLLALAGQPESAILSIFPDGFIELIHAALDSKEAVTYLEYPVATRTISYEIVPVPEHRYVNLYGRDITEQKHAELENTKLEARLQQMQKLESIGRLTGGIAHDFNNMLNVILGYTELIRLDLDENDPIRLDLGEIEKAAVHARDVTRQLLAFSRKQIISPKPQNLNLLIDHISLTLSRVINENIEISFHPAPDLWIISMDRAQVEQILINLAANARDAMPDGGVLTIETGNVHLDAFNDLDFVTGDYVQLAVSDTGTGIDRDMMSRIFEPFFTTKGVGEGTGLGLSTVYGIVKQNSGQITVYSEPGQGTTFKIYLPRILEDSVETAATDDRSVIHGDETIMLIEDDPLVQRVTTAMLRSLGYTVLPATTPSKVLSVIGAGTPSFDLLMTDLVMPEMNGAELRDKAVAIRPDVRVLFMSGYTENVIVHHGMLEEGVHYLQKPFNITELSQQVHRAIHGS